MKTLITTIFLFCSLFCICYAQNKVTVKQNGTGNNVSINQSDKSKRTDGILAKPVNCNEFLKSTIPDENLIYIKDEGSGNTVYKTKGVKKNSFYLNQNAKNSSSTFYFSNLPDTIATKQNGTKNGIYLYMSNSDSLGQRTASKINLGQQGNMNVIAIGPCKNTDKLK